MEVSFAGKKLTLADIRKVSKIIPTEGASEFKAGGLAEVVKDLPNDFVLRDMARVFARKEGSNMAKQLRTDVVITGGNTKTLNDVNSMKGDLEICGEWAPWSKVYQLSKK